MTAGAALLYPIFLCIGAVHFHEISLALAGAMPVLMAAGLDYSTIRCYPLLVSTRITIGDVDVLIKISLMNFRYFFAYFIIPILYLWPSVKISGITDIYVLLPVGGIRWHDKSMVRTAAAAGPAVRGL